MPFLALNINKQILTVMGNDFKKPILVIAVE